MDRMKTKTTGMCFVVCSTVARHEKCQGLQINSQATMNAYFLGEKKNEMMPFQNDYYQTKFTLPQHS